MKKILAIALALVLVLSMGMVALAEEPALGTAENPYQVSTPMMTPNSVTVAAGATDYYAFNSNFFNNMTLTASAGLTAIVVDGVDYHPSLQLGGGIEATLVAYQMVIMVGFVNSSDADVTVTLEFAQATLGGSQDTAVEVYTETDNEFVCEGQEYWSVYYVNDMAGDLTFNIDADLDAYEAAIFSAYETRPLVTGMPDADGKLTLTVTADTYTPYFVCLHTYAPIAGVITVEMDIPEVGTEENPVQIWWSSDLEELTVPANSTLYVTLYDILSSCVGAYVDKELVTATVDGEEITFIEGGENAPYSVTIALTNDSDEDVVAPLWLEYPAGTYDNPEYIGNGETKLNATAYSYYYTYIALNDGKLTVKVDSIDTIAGLSLENIIVRDPDYDGSNYEKYFDYMGNHADKDAEGNTVYDDETCLPVYSSPSQYYATIEVSKGDEIVIAIEGKTDDEDNLIPMDATLTVDGPQAPVGHYENMDKFEVGKNSFTISGEDVLYCGTWTAPANGTITVTLVGDVYEFAMGEMETEDPVILSETDKLVLKVKKGEQIAFMAVAGMDETTGEFVDTDVELTLDFVEDKEDSPATGATGATAAVLLTLVSAAGLAVLSKKRNA